MKEKHTKYFHVKTMANISLCTAVIIISSWLTIPLPVSFTLQTLSIFVICSVFSARVSFFSILLYVMLGVCGIPVFSNFGAGISVLIGPTGGFIFSFLLIPFIFSLFRGNKRYMLALSMILSQIACYILGALWYAVLLQNNFYSSIISAFAICVVPFLIFDTIKIIVALLLSPKLKRIIKE